MRRSFLFFFLILLILLLSLYAQEQSASKMSLEHADKFYRQKLANDYVQKLEGNVHFKQGETNMFCDFATYYQEQGKVIFSGNVRFVDEKKNLTGKQIVYYEQTKIAVAEKDVIYSDSLSIVTCDYIKYFSDEDKVFADHNVVLLDTINDMQLTGDHIEYWQKEGYAKAVGNPVFTQPDSTDTLTVLGELIESFKNGSRALVVNNVEIRKGEIRAFCDTLEFLKDRDLVNLIGKPYANRAQDYMTGQKMGFVIKDQKITGIKINGKGIVQTATDSLLTTDIPFNLLTGEDIWVIVSNNEIDSVRVKGRATSYYHVLEDDEEKGINKVLGDELLIDFNEQKIKSVNVKSNPSPSEGAFYPFENSQRIIEKELKELLVNQNKAQNE